MISVETREKMAQVRGVFKKIKSQLVIKIINTEIYR